MKNEEGKWKVVRCMNLDSGFLVALKCGFSWEVVAT